MKTLHDRSRSMAQVAMLVDPARYEFLFPGTNPSCLYVVNRFLGMAVLEVLIRPLKYSLFGGTNDLFPLAKECKEGMRSNDSIPSLLSGREITLALCQNIHVNVSLANEIYTFFKLCKAPQGFSKGCISIFDGNPRKIDTLIS